MMQIMAGKPATGSPQISVLMKKYNSSRMDTPQKTTPVMDAIASGAVEKAVMPSMEYRNSFQKFHLVSPATRSTFSYSNHLVR